MLRFRASLGPISRLGRGHTGLLFRTQVALLLAYSGTRYQGLQKNPGAVTVEVSLKVAATKSSVTRQLKKICDTCVRVRVGVSVSAWLRARVRVRLG